MKKEIGEGEGSGMGAGDDVSDHLYEFLLTLMQFLDSFQQKGKSSDVLILDSTTIAK